jgi:hypothetical protein
MKEWEMRPLKFLRRHWHDIGLFSAIVAGAYLIFAWNEIVLLQKLLVLNLIVVLLHQFEEYSWPGGFPAIFNMILVSSASPDRYPLNQNSSMVANVILAYGFYLVPVFYADVIWLGLAPILLGMVIQFIGHVIYVNMKLRSLYSPGVATTVFGHVPIAAVIYIYHISAHHLANGRDWLLAVVYMIIFLSLLTVLELILLGGKDSPYPFDQDEMKRFDIEKRLERARR